RPPSQSTLRYRAQPGARCRQCSHTGRVQPVDATPGCWSEFICSLKTSAGVRQHRAFRGVLLSARATPSRSSPDHRDRSVPFGKYCRSSPLVFSFVGRCQGECGSAQNTFVPVSRVNRACPESSLPRSQVRVLRSCSCRRVIDDVSAVFIALAPYPHRDGPFFVVYVSTKLSWTGWFLIYSFSMQGSCNESTQCT